jgi:RimJ/RimL family protein N-acetyltransferase
VACCSHAPADHPDRWRPADLDAYAALNADPQVMAEIGPLTRAQSDSSPATARSGTEARASDCAPVVRREDGVCVGMCGLHRHRWYPDDVEVGWRLARHAWGQGYATEAATRWLDHAFGPIGLDRVISITSPGNARSLAVMGRLGMVRDHEREHESGRGPVRVVVHVLTRARWVAGS